MKGNSNFEENKNGFKINSLPKNRERIKLYFVNNWKKNIKLSTWNKGGMWERFCSVTITMKKQNQMPSYSGIWKEQEILFLRFALEWTQAQSGDVYPFTVYIANVEISCRQDFIRLAWTNWIHYEEITWACARSTKKMDVYTSGVNSQKNYTNINVNQGMWQTSRHEKKQNLGSSDIYWNIVSYGVKAKDRSQYIHNFWLSLKWTP